MKKLYEGKEHFVKEIDEGGHGYGLVPCDQPLAKVIWVSESSVKDIPEKKETETNPILDNVKTLLEQQTQKGIEKYGNTVKTSDYTMIGWLEHLQMELVDALVYTETLKAKVKDVEKVLG